MGTIFKASFFPSHFLGTAIFCSPFFARLILPRLCRARVCTCVRTHKRNNILLYILYYRYIAFIPLHKKARQRQQTSTDKSTNTKTRQGKANGYEQTDTHKHAKQAKTNRQAPNRHKAQSIYKKRAAVSCAKNIPFLAFVLVMMDNNQQTTANTLRMRKKPQKNGTCFICLLFCTQKHTQKPQYRRDTSVLHMYCKPFFWYLG